MRSGCARYYFNSVACGLPGAQPNETIVRTSSDEYDSSLFVKSKDDPLVEWESVQCYTMSNKRSIGESGILEDHCLYTKKPFFKAERTTSSDGSWPKSKGEIGKDVMVKVEETDYGGLYYDFDDSSEKTGVAFLNRDHDYYSIESSNSCKEEQPSAEQSFSSSSSTNDDKSVIIRNLENWLHASSENQNAFDGRIIATNAGQDKGKNLSNTRDDFPRSSYTGRNQGQESLEQNLFTYGTKPYPSVRQRYPETRSKRGEKYSSADVSKVKSIQGKKTNSVSQFPEVGSGNHNSLKEQSSHNSRRMTRSLIKSIENVFGSENARNQVGKFVWGRISMAWWPAIVVAAEDVGIEPKVDKVCVYWIGEDLISLLNEKTQVEPFSSSLDSRLLRHLEDERVPRDRKKACFVTLKLFSKRLNIPLIKPHVAWAQKHLMGKNHLNDVICSPLPKYIQQRLAQLKQENTKAKAKIERSKEEARSPKSPNDSSSLSSENRDSLDKKLKDNGSRSSKFPKYLVRKSAKELLSSSAEDLVLPLMDQKPGVIVWGKISGHSWWPAMIIHHHDCGTKEPNFGCQWILWYGDYQLSQVHYENVMKFDEGIKKMQSYVTQCKRQVYTNAVLNACKDYCARLNYDTSKWTMDDVLAWVSSLSTTSKMPIISRPNDESSESRYSSHIVEKLNEMKANQGVAAERESQIENCDALKAVFAGLCDTLEVLCIICLKIHCKNLQEHPFFNCVLCTACLEEFKAAIFAYGDDGKCFYCTLCAGSDTIVMCDSYDCPRVYCTACLKYLIAPAGYDEILLKDPWLCFLCDDSYKQEKSRIFKPRADWKKRMGQLFHKNIDTSWNKVWDNSRERKSIRVLSLFDGISTGLLVLENLGIIVEDYYAAEIDADAQTVSMAHFGDKIYQLGDVRSITQDVIDSIAPIDLLIGGSPCNDLSVANPNRLGLNDPNGTGVLFFEYCRIKNLVTEANGGHHLFWLFENVASMQSRYRIAINQSLNCEPYLIDAADFSPQHRPRLFWSNLPIGVNFPPPDPSQNLQSVLTPNCNRHALVKKIQTVTTKVNSLKQGVSLLKPVLMNGAPDSLWITELELIFGFPRHFTDVKNLSATKRQKLIGQSWSVQTITAILRPLCYFFLLKTPE
ncbi:DNA (cytosine-5)-methyltransferase 3B-like isoform X1 [Neodiprion fabricii]|uniref:DNA (cytosine-5)-methyltransferase 3B-like isoform X1 n=1 Tax=Neodiprion fabricii TaxID=2872261 RepID=UPI001ED9718A|nr:DNA (cytosine-5)-methyltransferase 3B-like isoform X1 [Neodiprion fabricii]